MKYFVQALLLTLLAVSAMAVEKSTSIEQYRSKGSKRIYQFFIKDQQIGTLESKFNGTATFDGVKAYEFSEKLDIDFTPMGQDYRLNLQNKHFVDTKGLYVGDDMKLVFGGQTQSLYLKKTDDGLTGYYIANDQKQDISRPMPEQYFAVDNYMIDQLEAFLAFQDIKIGDTIETSIIIPQVMATSTVNLVVEDYKMMRYGDVFDSAYVCHFFQPSGQTVYFTKDKRIIRVDQTSQNMTIILKESPLEKMKMPAQPFAFMDFVKRIPIYLVFLILGIIFSSALIWKYHRKPEIYIVFVLGGLIYLAMHLTQFPLQRWYSAEYALPGMRAGGSIYSYAAVIALMAAFVQVTLILIPVGIMSVWKKPKQSLAVALGVFCGFGFGLYEAGSVTGALYQAGKLAVLSWPVFHQSFALIFHMTTGAALAYGINRGFKHLLLWWVILVLVSTLANYMFVFLNKGIFDTGVHELLLAGIYLFTLLAVFIMIQRARR